MEEDGDSGGGGVFGRRVTVMCAICVVSLSPGVAGRQWALPDVTNIYI